MSALLTALLLPPVLAAQPAAGSRQLEAPPADTLAFRALQWTNLGPNRGGRSIAAAGSRARPLEYYFGATGGGLWKTTDGGTTWKPVTDGFLGSASVGAVAVCEANPDVVYLGTGEVQLRGNILPGDGVYRSMDAGKTWSHVGLREARNIGRVRVHPTDCDRVYAAAFGEYGTPSAERGIYRSTDGGKSWQKVLYRDERTGGVDLVIDPSNPSVLYAALWEAWRKPWGMSSGGAGSGLFRSTDGGTTWTELSAGLRAAGAAAAERPLGKIGVSVSPANPNRVYAIVEADSGGVFRSDDAGKSWARVNSERKLRQRAFYYTRIYADPKEKDHVYVLNVGFFRSTDGGKTFDKQIRVPHGDNHDLWIAPDDPKRMIEANDGGANVSTNGGESWTEQDYPTAQLYRIALTAHQPAHVCGGQQDNSTVCVPVRDWQHLLARGGANQQYFYAAGGCESGYVAPHPADPNLFFAGCYGGALERYDHRTGQTRPVNVWPENPMGQSAKDLRERFQWTFPIVFSPQDPRVLYTTSQHVWKSTDQGQSWERISPDLTRAAPETMGASGGPITLDQTGVETYPTVFALAPSPREAGLIWAGSDDGLVHLTRDGGRSWQQVTPPELPEFTKITTLEASPHRPGTAYLAGHRFLLGDHAPYLFRTDDYGRSWTRITVGIPADEIARSIREDPLRPRLLYAGTERGVWLSFDDGAAWQPLQSARDGRTGAGLLPVTQVADLAVTDRDLVVATHGRSFWAMHDIAPLRQMAAPATPRRATLYQPAPAVRGVDRGVTIHYALPRAARSVRLEFLDAEGKRVRAFDSRPPKPDTAKADSASRAAAEEDEEEGGAPREPAPETRAGLNRFVWDLRHPGYTAFPKMILWAGRNAGPVALPGRYRVRLLVDGRAVQTQPFEVRLDPRLTGVTPEALRQRFELATQIRDRVSQANQAVLLVRGIRQQADSLLPRIRDPQTAEALRGLLARLAEVEGEIYQVRNQSNQDPLNYPIRLNNKLAALLGHVEEAEVAPTAASRQVFSELSSQLDTQLARLDALLDAELPALNQRLRAERLRPVRAERVKGGTGDKVTR